MVKLGVNIDHIATLRQARRDVEPDPVLAAGIAELAGADGITVHLREDRRHIQDRDLRLLRETIASKLNMEMAATEEILKVALEVKPDEVCLVPEKRQELTTEGGLNVAGQKMHIGGIIEKLHKAGIKVSVFIDPDERQIKAAAEVGADTIELHTGAYSEACRNRTHQHRAHEELMRLKTSGALARTLELTLNAGHGLDYRNVAPVAGIPEMNELNIGFSIIARAALVGLDRAVREMKEKLS